MKEFLQVLRRFVSPYKKYVVLSTYLVLRVFFLEFASSRYFTFRFGKKENELSVEASENPGLEFIEALLESQDKTTKALLGIAGKLIDPDLVDGKARAVFSPTFVVRHKEE